jgi:Domain of unknown function (DUF4404)
MNADKVRSLLGRLIESLDPAKVDPDTLASTRAFEVDALRTIDSREAPAQTLLNQAKALEVKFAVEHPLAERILREIIETLARMGV